MEVKRREHKRQETEKRRCLLPLDWFQKVKRDVVSLETSTRVHLRWNQGLQVCNRAKTETFQQQRRKDLEADTSKAAGSYWRVQWSIQKITGSGPLCWEQNDKRLFLFIMLLGVFHFEMTFTGGPGSLSPSLLFFPHIGKTHSPLTSFFIQINIPDRLEETGKENTAWPQKMPFHLQLTGIPVCVSNLQFRKYTHRLYSIENSLKNNVIQHQD